MQENELLRFKGGDVIFREGEFSITMYAILSGKVGIYSKYGEKGEKLLTTLGEESYFGEMGLIEAMPRSATAVALEDTTIKRIDSANFSTYFTERPAQLLTIMQHMSNRLRELSGDYLSACQTISEYLDAEAAKAPKSQSLLDRMKKFVGVYKNSK